MIVLVQTWCSTLGAAHKSPELEKESGVPNGIRRSFGTRRRRANCLIFHASRLAPRPQKSCAAIVPTGLRKGRRGGLVVSAPHPIEPYDFEKRDEVRRAIDNLERATKAVTQSPPVRRSERR
jgi:hypothetical protein